MTQKRVLQTYKKAPKQSAKNMLGMSKRVTVKLGRLVEKCPGGRHGIYESNVGLLRKPLQ